MTAYFLLLTLLPGNYWASLLTGQGFGALGLFVLGAGCCLHPGVASDVVELIPFAYFGYHHLKVCIMELKIYTLFPKPGSHK